ncbi:MAG TPA: hypothetical protein VIH90_02555 [Candidatus Saccharimonadales bacterium]
MASSQGPEQPTLYVRAIESGQMIAHDFSLDGLVAVSTAESNLHFQNVLTYVRRSMMLRDTVGPVTPEMETQREEYNRLARESYDMATGIDKLFPAFRHREITRERASHFLNYQKVTDRYYLAPDRLRAAFIRRHELVDSFRREQWFRKSRANRERGIHLPKRLVVEPKRGTLSAEELTLNDQERMSASYRDTRAGFLPTTDKEKTFVLGALNYLNNPDFPLYMTNQLLEVINRTMRIKKNPEIDYLDRDRVTITLVYELEDYIKNAVASRAALEELDLRLIDCVNTRVTVAEEAEQLAGTEAGLIALLRYIDLKKYMDHGVGEVFARPTKFTDDARVMDRGEGKHKTVNDQYTSPVNDEDEVRRILAVVGNMKIGEIRGEITSAIIDQSRRESFHKQILEQIANPPADLPGPARRALNKTTELAREIYTSIYPPEIKDEVS